MRVEPNDSTQNAFRVSSLKAKHIATPNAAAEEAADFAASAQLLEKLEQVESTRAGKVEAAKALVADPNYPGSATLAKVADVIAEGLASEKRQ
ncbi:MAG TPA: hypothetical protein VEH04_04025 [Verrucomicrobiae bacterium]|nr:hypothetical protein [Verrucomicrobiae bacterium]